MAELRLVKAYWQVNTVRGYRYLDDAGKIMNRYDADFPEKTVGLDGLHMVNRENTLDEVRVSVQRIWLGFSRPDTLQFVLDHSANMTGEIADAIGVTEATRFGVRLEYLSPVPDVESAARHTARQVYAEPLLAALGEVSGFEAMVETKAKGLEIGLRVRPVRRASGATDTDLPEFGIMFDADVFRRDDGLLIADVRKFTRDAQRWTKDSLPAIADRVLSGISNV